MPQLTAQNWGSPCKRLPSQTPPRPRPQPPSLWSPERSRRRLCSCCSAHEILMRERLAGGGAPPPPPGPRLCPPPTSPRLCNPPTLPFTPSRGSGPGRRGAAGRGGSARPPPRPKGTSRAARSASSVPASSGAMATLARLDSTAERERAGMERRAAHDCGHGEQKPGAAHRTKRLVPEYQVLNQHDLGVCLSINPARGYGGVKIRTHV